MDCYHFCEPDRRSIFDALAFLYPCIFSASMLISVILCPPPVKMECCGWNGRADWSGNMVIVNSSQLLFPCSCQNRSDVNANYSQIGFCEAPTPDWPVYDVVNNVFYIFTCVIVPLVLKLVGREAWALLISDTIGGMTHLM